MEKDILVEFTADAVINSIAHRAGDRIHMDPAAASFWQDKGLVTIVNVTRDLGHINIALENVGFDSRDVDVIFEIFRDHGIIDDESFSAVRGVVTPLRDQIHELVGELLGMSIPGSKFGIEDMVNRIERFMKGDR